MDVLRLRMSGDDASIASLRDHDALRKYVQEHVRVAHVPADASENVAEAKDEADHRQPTPDNPTPDEPTPDEPTPDKHEADKPTPDKPTPDEPTPDEPTLDEPKADEPKADEPKADRPKADRPKADRPKADRPKADEPKADKRRRDKQVREKPSATRPRVQTFLRNVHDELAKMSKEAAEAFDERDIIAKSVVSFLEAYARLHSLEPERVFFSFIVGFAEKVAQVNSQYDRDLYLGDLAPLVASYAVLAANIMLRTDLTEYSDSFDRVYALCRTLDKYLRCRSPEVIKMSGAAGDFVSSRLAARCAIPFAFGYMRMLRDDKLEFTLRALLRQEDKSVTHTLSFLDIAGGDDTEASKESRAEREDGDMRPRLTAQRLKRYLSKTPLPYAMLQGIGYHCEDSDGYDKKPMEGFAQRVLNHQGAIPPAKGSILRAYVRSTLDIEGDTLEPTIQHVHDCVFR
jgi:hypothetical protein